MLSHNELVLDICGGRCTSTQAVDRMSAVMRIARRTRDLRFLDLASLLEELVTAAHRGADPEPSPVRRRVEGIRTNGRVPMEIFVSARIGDVEIEMPFVFSPNWRY